MGITDEGMDFGEALNFLRAGDSLARTGWNGKGMFIILQKGYPEGVPANLNTATALKIEEGTMVKILPYIHFKTANGELVPWVASHSDLLAEDWKVTA